MAFFDTNVLVYTQDDSAPAKRAVARALVEQAIAAGQFTISTQVMQEFYAVAARKRLLSATHAVALLQAWAENEVVRATPGLLFRAFALQQSRRLSVWDALVVQAALDAGCTMLYSEDLQAGERFGSLAVLNPFAAPAAAHEAAPAYAASQRARKKARR